MALSRNEIVQPSSSSFGSVPVRLVLIPATRRIKGFDPDRTRTKYSNTDLILRIVQMGVKNLLGQRQWALETRSHYTQIRQILFVVDVLVRLEFAERHLMNECNQPVRDNRVEPIGLVMTFARKLKQSVPSKHL